MVYFKLSCGVLLSCLALGVYAEQKTTNIGTRNDNASCDSTCMAQANQISHESNIQQRIVPCLSGFTGTRFQTRVKLADGSWGTWTDKDIDNCVCTPTYQDRTGVCPTGQKGSLIERSNWTCTGPKSGSWGSWATQTNNCYTPCATLPDETRQVSCATNYTGSITQKRTSSCSSDDRQAPTWSNWTTVSTNCTYNPPKPACEPVFTGTWGDPEVCRWVSSTVLVSYESLTKCLRYGEWVNCEERLSLVCEKSPIYTKCP